MESYLASGEWRGKAGGYAIQGLAGGFVVKLVGSYTNVVGLPLYETVGLLDGEGYPVHFNWLVRCRRHDRRQAARIDAAPAEAPCPICGKPSARDTYPFCSTRCADIDLNRWLSGAYAIPARDGEDEDGSEAPPETERASAAGKALFATPPKFPSPPLDRQVLVL